MGGTLGIGRGTTSRKEAIVHRLLALSLLLSWAVGSSSLLQDMICQCDDKAASVTAIDDMCNAIELMGGTCRHKFNIIPGFSGEIPDNVMRAIEQGSMPEAAHACLAASASYSLESIRCLPNQDVWGQNDRQDVPGLWNLDILDGRNDKQYEYGRSMGSGVRIYVLDTGVSSRHPQFQYPDEDIKSGLFKPSDTRVESGFSSLKNPTTEDCFGHGTAVAGVAAGKTFGVAKNATIVSVRTLNCEGLAKADQVVLAMDWVLENHRKPAVVQMSLTTQSIEPSMDRAASTLVAAGLAVIAAAGNFNTNTSNCSPAREPSVITVGAITIDSKPWKKSNWGPAVTMMAPGTSILSAWKVTNGKPAIKRSDGTSVAAPHVSGAVALHLQYHPHHTPQQVLEVLMRNSRTGVLVDVDKGTPNVLLSVDARANVALVDVSTRDLGDELIFPDGNSTKQMIISNVGSAALRFTLNMVASGIFGGWLSAWPRTGTLEPGTNVTVTVGYDALGMLEGQYSGRVVVDSDALNEQVDIEAGLLVLCEEMEGQEQSMAHTIEFLDDLSLAAHDPSPPWQEFGDIAVNLEAHVWVQIAVRFSHPVKSLPRDAISASVGSVIEVLELDIRAKMCGDYAIRLRVPVEPWGSSKSQVCLTLTDGGLKDVYGHSFPEAKHCVEAEHRPFARMFGMDMLATGAQAPSTDKSSVNIMLAFSKPIDILSLGVESFSVYGGPAMDEDGGPLVARIQQAHLTAPFWTVAVEIPESYQGLVSVSLKDGAVVDEFGNLAMPMQPFVFRRDLSLSFVEQATFLMAATPGMLRDTS